jgi:hypothetical protein
MIVFNLKNLEDFIHFLQRKITDVYFYIDEDSHYPEFPGKDEIKLTLHFLGKINDSALNGLYQTQLFFSKSLSEETIFLKMQDVFKQTGDIKLISGRISEIYYSIS